MEMLEKENISSVDGEGKCFGMPGAQNYIEEPVNPLYDQLINMILHPGAKCMKPKTFGGIMRKDGRIDGDKILCMDTMKYVKRNECLVYSFGIGYDWTFEEAVSKAFGCEIFAFDPSVNAKGPYPNIHFYKIGVSNFNGLRKYGKQMWNMTTLKSIIERFGHQNRTIDIFKMDIEGDEIKALEHALKHKLLKKINNMCVEFHIHTIPNWTRITNLLRRIKTEGKLLHFNTQNNTIAGVAQVPGFIRRHEYYLFELAWFREH